jgi:hypothetical protein
MARFKGLQEMLKRYRRPGDIVFAWAFLGLSVFLASQIGTQSPWTGTRQLFSQPAFWPTVALGLMTLFAALHLLSSMLSARIPGRWREVWEWVRAVEYAGWFMAYVWVVPYAGYLLSTVTFAMLLGLRAGYRARGTFGALVLMAVVIVVLFKGFLQVKIPGGAIYEFMPDGLRAFMLTYF